MASLYQDQSNHGQFEESILRNPFCSICEKYNNYIECFEFDVEYIYLSVRYVRTTCGHEFHYFCLFPGEISIRKCPKCNSEIKQCEMLNYFRRVEEVDCEAPIFSGKVLPTHETTYYCSICLNNVIPLTADQLEDTRCKCLDLKYSYIILECGHAFHRHCFKGWLHEQATCPCCRNQLKSVIRVNRANIGCIIDAEH